MSTTPALPSPVRTDEAVPMTPSEGLDIVHELACLNQLDPFEMAGDEGLAAQGRRHSTALDRLGGLLFEHADAIDAQFALPSLALCMPVAVRLCQAERDMDPEVPSNAVRICLELAQDAALEVGECGTEAVLLAGRARQQRAFAVARAFLSLQAEMLDAAFGRTDAQPGATSGRNADDPSAGRASRPHTAALN